MRHALAAVILLVSSPALANPKAIEKTVKSSIVDLAKLADNTMLGFSDDAVIYSAHGGQIEKSEGGCVKGAVANAFYGCMMASVEHKPGTIAVGEAGGIGWFQAPFTAIITGQSPDGKAAKPQKDALRFGGIVVGSGTSWSIVAAMYSRPISDKQLLAGTDGTPATGSPKLGGDQKLAGVVAGWFKTGFAAAAAKKGNLIASGTSPTELKTGAGAVTLAKSWDKLKLGATDVDAKLLADGKVGWVHATVMLPRKNGKGAVQMQLTVVVVPDGDSWRWVSMMYQPFEPNI